MSKSAIHWAWVILAVCFVDLFVNYSVRLGYGVVLPEMIRELGFSRTAGGSIFNAYLLCYICLTPLTGYLTDRLGARMVITACALLLAAGALLMGRASGAVSAGVAFGLCGLGSTGMWTPVITVVQRWFAPNRRGLALGVLSTGYGLGFATMGMAFPFIVAGLSWRWAWYFPGMAALVLVAANGVFIKSTPEAAGSAPWGERPGADATPPTPMQKGALAQVFKGRVFWLIGASYFCIAFALYGMTTFMVDYARYQLGLPLSQASILATIHGLSQIAGVLIILPASDRLGRRNTILISNAMITSCLAGVLIWGGNWGALCVTVGVFAMFYGATFPIYGACAGDYFPRRVMGSVVGAWTPFYGAGAMSTHWVAGLTRDLSGDYSICHVVNVAMAAIGLALMLLVPSKRPGD